MDQKKRDQNKRKENKKKAITAILCLLDTEGFDAFDEIPYLSLIRPVVKRDRIHGLSLQRLSIRYGITISQVRWILKKCAAK